MTFGGLIISAILAIGAAGGTAMQHFNTIGVKNGLSDNYVRDIEQSSDGYMWFATLDGLDRYDGYTFVKYSLSEFGINHDVFGYVREDAGGTLWVKTTEGEMFYYDPSENRLRMDLASRLSPMGITREDVTDLFVDEEGSLWVQSSDSLYSYSYAERRRMSFLLPEQCSAVSSAGGCSYALLKNGDVWMLGQQRRCILSEGTDTPLNGIHGDNKGRLWAYGRVLTYYDPASDAWTSYPLRGLLPEEDFVRTMADVGEDLWFGTDRSGVYVLDESLVLKQMFRYEPDLESSIPGNHINCILFRNGIIWMGVGYKGIVYAEEKPLDVRRYRTGISENIGSFAEDGSGRLLVGFDGRGLMVTDPADGSPTGGSRYADGLNIVDCWTDRNGTVYFCTYGNGVYSWDGSIHSLSGNNRRFHRITDKSQVIRGDRTGRLWIGTYHNGIVRLDPDGNMEQYTTDNSDLLSDSIISMTDPSSGGTIYTCTREGLYAITTEQQPGVTLLDNSIRQLSCLCLDGRGILWIGSTDGLYYIDWKRDPEPQRLTVADGLSHNHILGICEDGFGHIWATTYDGVNNIFILDDPMADHVTVRCYPYFAEDGIGEGMFNPNAIYCTSDGLVLMGLGDNIISVRPELYPPVSKAQAITITQVLLSGDPVPPAVLQEGKPLRMKFYDRLWVEVSTMDYHGHLTRFEYRVDNQKDWVLMTGNALYINMPKSGRHSLEIRPVSSNPGIPSAHLDLCVSPPFYRSALAITAYILLLLGGLLYAIHRVREHNRKRIEAERQRANEAKFQFFTNVSHDLRTPLTLIISPLQQLIHKHRGQPLAGNLEQIQQTAKMLLNEIDQILDFKQINGELSFNPTYGNLSRFVEETCRAYVSIVKENPDALTLDVGATPVMTSFDTAKMGRILYNLVGNAFKYGGDDCKVTVSVAQEDGRALVRVADNGPGISDKAKAHIFERFYREEKKPAVGNGIGLNIVQEFVRLHGGEVTVSDNQPHGSVFTVSLPIREEVKPLPASAKEEKREGRLRILNAEDNPAFRHFVTECLSSEYDVTEASNGREALALLESGPYDLILSDVLMPEMGGRELCRALRADIRYASIPIILLTALHGKEQERENLKAGADDSLEKPFDVETLHLRIAKLLKAKAASAPEAPEWQGSRSDRELLARISAELEEHLTDSEYGVEALCESLNISRSVLYKRIMALTGIAPLAYIRKLRLEKGRALLEGGETSISQVAWSVGFSPKQFSRHFRDEYGCLPTEYLQHLRK